MMEFYLFDVQHGQSAAVRLPNGRWCLFDAGDGRDGSPTQWIRRQEAIKQRVSQLLHARTSGSSLLDRRLASIYTRPQFQYLKMTVSHLHHDHLSDWEAALGAAPEFLRTVDFDGEYLQDLKATSHPDSYASVSRFCGHYKVGFTTATLVPDYGGVAITEHALPVRVAGALGGAANSRVNNASVITRINYSGNSILLCGDMETDAWEFALNHSPDRQIWQSLASNIDILVAPHHGHSSAYSTSLMAWARPSVVLVSVKSYDEHVDTRYSSNAVSGITLGTSYHQRITTRKHGTIKIELSPTTALFGKGTQTWYLNHPLA
jgi:hypothetical protein